MGKIFLILILILSCNFSVQAQEGYEPQPDTIAQTVVAEPSDEEEEYEEVKQQPADTILVQRNIYLAEDSILNWKKRKEYAYIKNLDSLLKASQQPTESKAPEMRAPDSGSFLSRLLGGPVIKIILWTLALFFVGIIVYQLLKSKGLFQSASTSRVSEKATEEEELLLQNDFDQLIQNAYKAGDYRMAVRYLFLKTLQQLRDKNHINYEPDKTNSKYVYEVPVNWRNDFSQLIFQYEYVWYGHFDINSDQYAQVQKGFNSFLQKV